MTGRLEGKVALITGAGSGMGRAAAELFAGEGARVVVADVDDDAGNDAVAAVARAGGDATFVHGRRRRVGRLRGDGRGRDATPTAALHVLYNNAGIFPADDGGVLDTPEATWDRVMDVNLKGVWLGLQGRDPGDARVGRRLDRQRRVVRRADGRGDRADRVHREQGRRARR